MKGVVLKVSGIGHVPNKKNSKMITRGNLITKPEYQKWVKRCIQCFESQLLSGTAITEGETLTAHLPHSLIASLLPHDDSHQWIVEEHVYAHRCNRGEEGATVTIEEV